MTICNLDLPNLGVSTQTHFCYFLVKEKISAIVYASYLLCLAALLCLTLKGTVSRWKIHTKNIKIAYLLLIAWSLLAKIEIGFSEWIYLALKDEEGTNVVDLSKYSKFTFAFTFTIILLFNSVIFLVMFHWFKICKDQNARSQLSTESGVLSSHLISEYSNSKVRGGYDFPDKFTKIMKGGFIVRCVGFVIWLIAYCIFTDWRFVKIAAISLLSLLVIESVFLSTFLIKMAVLLYRKSKEMPQNK
jgi:hypothetical protein